MASSIISTATGFLGRKKQREGVNRIRDALTTSNEEATFEWEDYYDNISKELSPFIDLGSGAARKLGVGLGVVGAPDEEGAGDFTRKFGFDSHDFEGSPGYQFRLDEGNKALDRVASRGGNMFSGGALKDASRWGQSLASDEYAAEYARALNNYNANQGIYGRLSNAVGPGLSAIGTKGNAGALSTGNISDLITQQGNINAGHISAKNNIAQGDIQGKGEVAKMVMSMIMGGMGGGAAGGAAGGGMGGMGGGGAGGGMGGMFSGLMGGMGGGGMGAGSGGSSSGAGGGMGSFTKMLNSLSSFKGS